MNGIAKSRAIPIHFFNSIAQSQNVCTNAQFVRSETKRDEFDGRANMINERFCIKSS